MKEVCATCKFWRREGVDGPCFGSIPESRIFAQKEAHNGLTFVRPRTDPNDLGCPGWKAINED